MRKKSVGTVSEFSWKTLESRLGPFINRFRLDFWATADRVGEHFIWKGPAPTVETVAFHNLPAVNVAWANVGRKLRDGESLRRACAREGCIRAEHQEVVRGRA